MTQEPQLEEMGFRTHLWFAQQALLRHRVRSAVTTFVIAAATAVVVMTTGGAAATQEAVLLRLESPSLRVIRLTDRTGQAAVRAEAVDRISALNSVEIAIALGPVGDVVRNSGLGDHQRGGNAGEAVGLRLFHGSAALEGASTAGRLPAPGEAVAGRKAMEALRFAHPSGEVVHHRAGRVAIVGSFSVQGHAALDQYVLMRSPTAEWHAAEFVIIVRQASDLDAVAELLPQILQPQEIGSLGMETPRQLSELRAALSADVASLNAMILAASLGASTVVVLVNALGLVSERRREFGLQRIQGATREGIAVQVALEAGALAVAAASIGALVGNAASIVGSSVWLDPALSGAIAVLVALAAIAGSIIPSAVAARLEPIYALR